jgi:hypothetical protein
MAATVCKSEDIVYAGVWSDHFMALSSGQLIRRVILVKTISITISKEHSSRGEAQLGSAKLL